MNNQVNIFDVANYIIENLKPPTTHMKLHKLIYYVYAKHLIEKEKPIFENEMIEAWTYGPVFPNLYLSLKHYYNNLIIKPLKKGNEKNLTDEHKKIINQVLEKYGSWTASELVTKVYGEKPWKNNFIEADWSLNIISDEDLYKYYGNSKTKN